MRRAFCRVRPVATAPLMRVAGLFCAVALLAGCNTTGRTPQIEQALNDYMYGQYPPAKAVLQPLCAKTNEDFALNNVRLGSVALVDYDLQLAESAFYRAYEVMNSVRVNDAGRAMGAALVSEKLRIWKGEPYERAMANFYLGLVYYMKHDYSNARAAFENALFKLRDYGEGRAEMDRYQEVESDFIIAYVMLGRCWQKLGEEDKAAAMFARVAQLRPDLGELASEERHAGANVVLVVDFGMGPQKVFAGDNSVMALVPYPAQVPPIPVATVRVNGRTIDARGFNRPPLDLLALAQERRWQDIDTIRVVKSVAGMGLMAAGAYTAGTSHHRDGEAAGLAMAGLGALMKASATADLRHWELLPRTVFILPLRLPPGRNDVTVSVGQWSQTWRGLMAPESGDSTYYVRINGLNNVGPFTWPPPSMAGAETAMGQQPISRTR